ENALQNRIWIAFVESQEFKHSLRIRDLVELEEFFLLAGHVHQRLPAQPDGLLRLLQQHVIVDIQDAGRVLSPIHVARDPEKRIGDARKHAHPSPRRTHVSLLPPPWEEFTTIDPGSRATRVRPPGTMMV